MKFTFLSIVLTMLIACNGPKQVSESAEIQQTTNDTLNNYTVSFISIGAGTDYKAKEKFIEFISKFEKSNKAKLQYEEIRWGKEGEVDYCFDFNADGKLKASFIKESKKILEASTLVRYDENVECKQGMR